MWNKLYRVVPVTTDTTSCFIIPSTYGCCEIPLVAEIVEPCEHGNYDEHIWGSDGFNTDGVFEPVTPCNGAGLEDNDE